MTRNSISLLFVFLLLLQSNSGFSQISKFHTWNLSMGTDALFPENNFKKTHKLGIGLTAKAEYLFAKHTSVIFSTGIYTLNGKTNLLNPDGEAATTLPLKIGGRYYLGNFYIGGETGWLYQQGFKPNNGFLYTFFIGDELIANRHGNSLDISLRHEAWVTDEIRSFVGLRLAYEFRLR